MRPVPPRRVGEGAAPTHVSRTVVLTVASRRNFLYDKGAFHTFVAPLIAGMRLGGSACQETEALVEAWGRSAGLAFQGLDDLVDLVSDPFASGKDTFQDIREGRLSLPLVLLQGLCKCVSLVLCPAVSDARTGGRVGWCTVDRAVAPSRLLVGPVSH